MVAYRYLSGSPLTAGEVNALYAQAAAPGGSSGGFAILNRPPVAAWLSQRADVPGAPELNNIDTERHTFVSDYYAAYLNCLDDAFDTAAQTLSARIQRWGASDPRTAEWLRGQDQVFANCGGDRMEWNPPPMHVVRAEFHAPAPLPPDADPLLAADRQYQTAAALFYGGEYKEAAEAFRSVARNTASPWRGSGQYLAARALLREGTVGGDNDALAAAEKALDQILSDPAQQRWHASARGLLDFVRGHLRPQDRMTELGESLVKPQPGPAFSQALTDYTALWDREEKAPASRSELADWITAFQAGDAAHAIERWRAGGNAAWLAAALVGVNPADPAAPELAAAARKIAAGSPAYATAAFHGIRVLTARNQPDEARKWADEALAASLGVPAHNAFLAERMALARDFTDFLRQAPRKPVAANDWMPDAKIEDSSLTFDWDAADAFNSKLPLRYWIEAAGSEALPRRMRGEIARAGWVRAALLDRPQQARELARLNAKLNPDLAGSMRGYQAEQAPDAARFDAAYTMLRNPGLAPIVRTGFGRETKVDQKDDLRDNWWVLQQAKSSPRAMPWVWPGAAGEGSEHRDVAAPAFLPPAERAEGERESKSLETNAAIAPDYLCAQSISWARAHRGDPRVPEALYLCVRATHFGMTGPGTSAWSRRAFQLLHAQYPGSEWTAKTKYWY